MFSPFASLFPFRGALCLVSRSLYALSSLTLLFACLCFLCLSLLSLCSHFTCLSSPVIVCPHFIRTPITHLCHDRRPRMHATKPKTSPTNARKWCMRSDTLLPRIAHLHVDRLQIEQWQI